MAAFVDTSALLAFLNRDDRAHTAVVPALRILLEAGEELVTHNYVLIETTALVGRRFGLGLVRRLDAEVTPLLTVDWVDAGLHAAAMDGLLTANRRRLSLVDCVSFAVMRRRGLDTALAIDSHFVEQGFVCLP